MQPIGCMCGTLDVVVINPLTLCHYLGYTVHLGLCVAWRDDDQTLYHIPIPLSINANTINAQSLISTKLVTIYN